MTIVLCELSGCCEVGNTLVKIGAPVAFSLGKENAQWQRRAQRLETSTPLKNLSRLVARSLARAGNSNDDQQLSDGSDPVRRGRAGSRHVRGRSRQGQVVGVRQRWQNPHSPRSRLE